MYALCVGLKVGKGTGQKMEKEGDYNRDLHCSTINPVVQYKHSDNKHTQHTLIIRQSDL